jgi:cell division protein FtsA
MQEGPSKYVVGIDIGTTTVRCVVGHIDGTTGVPTIVGVGAAPNSGMRKGNVVNLTGPAAAIDEALGEAERMSGYQVDAASISVNGTHILSTHTDGMIAVGSTNHEITEEDVIRLEEVATLGKVPANREILDVIPHAYKLDGQENIKNPVGMTGTRLEIDAHVVSVLNPNILNLQKTTESAKVTPRAIIVAGVAAARAVLTEHQIENGVVLIDLGGSTTNVAVYEEGDLRFTAVIPIGGNNITNDLAIGLKIDQEVAEKLKIEHVSAVYRGNGSGISLEFEGEIISFNTKDIDEIVEARLEEIFEAVNHELRKVGREGKLPSGAVLTGGTAQLKGIAEFAKEALGLAAKVGIPTGYGGVADDINKPQFATVLGLMLIDSEMGFSPKQGGKHSGSSIFVNGVGFISKLLGRLKP